MNDDLRRLRFVRNADVRSGGSAQRGLPSFFSGLMPEGHRLTLLKDAVTTSLGAELSLLLAVGSDVPGDVQVVPAGESPEEPLPLANTSRP